MGFDGTAGTGQHLLTVKIKDGKTVPVALSNGQAFRRSGCGGNVGDKAHGRRIRVSARHGQGRRQYRRKNANLRGGVMAITAIAMQFAQIAILGLGVVIGVDLVRVVAEVRVCHRCIMLAIRRCHRPTGLVRQDGKQKNEDEAFHAK